MINMEKMGGGGFAAAPHFPDIGYGPSVACTVGCTWLMYSLCMAHVWPMYDLHMAQITRVPWQKKCDLLPHSTVTSAPVNTASNE